MFFVVDLEWHQIRCVLSGTPVHISRIHSVQQTILVRSMLTSMPAVVALPRERERESPAVMPNMRRNYCNVTRVPTTLCSHLAFHLVLSSICVEHVPFPKVRHDGTSPSSARA